MRKAFRAEDLVNPKENNRYKYEALPERTATQLLTEYHNRMETIRSLPIAMKYRYEAEEDRRYQAEYDAIQAKAVERYRQTMSQLDLEDAENRHHYGGGGAAEQ